MHTDLEERGCAVVEAMLTVAECRSLIAMYGEEERFREERARKMKENAAKEKAAKEAAAKAGN